MNYISVQKKLGIPKYQQIIQSIEKAIATKKLAKGTQLPSVNKVCLTHQLSRDTVLQAYDDLKKRGIVFAIPGKGYYIKSTEVHIKQKIFLLFDELNIFKEDLYNSFLKNIGNDVQVDLFFHHFNFQFFQKIISENNGNYTKYIIMPTAFEGAATVIKTLPVNDVYILDQTNSELSDYPSIHQNFVKNIYDGLLEGKYKLDKYQKLIIIFPGFREPLGMKTGFLKFCHDFGFDQEVMPEYNNKTIRQGEVYITPNDRDLVKVIEKAKSQNLVIGKDYGIVSYNETPLKKIVENGITTISTDFEQMGKILAEMILKGKKEQIENKCHLILRSSL